MSQRHHNLSANTFDFGSMGLGTLDVVGPDDQDGAMTGVLDSSIYGFDPMPMTVDGANDISMSQAFAPIMPPGSNGNAESAMMRAEDQIFQGISLDENIPGRGPMPTTTIGSAASLPGGSTLTEFTKRRNWPAKVVEELKDFLHILDAHGRVKHVSPSVTPLTGWQPDEILDKLLKDLIHPDDVGLFVSELNESIATGSPMRLFYRLKKKDGSYAIFESVGHAHIAAAKFAPNPNNQSPFCQAVFVMSRPYPTKNSTLLDSFLEHKIENERLRRRIADLRKEEAEEAEDAQRLWRQSQEGRSDVTLSEDTMINTSAGTSAYIPAGDSSSMPPPERPGSLNVALTRENLEGAIAGSRPDSIREKMARYEGVSHADTIEMLTGLRYQEGERSRGITTGNASPTLIKGDAGIAIPIDRDPRTGEKKKKLKVAEEYVCTDCGTLDSPEWRKGPSGPKTLCNACGLRWAKKEKKRNNANNGVSNGPAALSLVDHSGTG